MASFKIIIAGSRQGFGYSEVETAMRSALREWMILPCDVTILSGTAIGVDQLGERFARELNLPLERYPADWDKHGKSAGIIRNIQMASYANALVALWDGESRGTKHMIEHARSRGLRVYVHHKAKG